MARIMVYLTDAELAYVKTKPRGFVRALVNDDIHSPLNRPLDDRDKEAATRWLATEHPVAIFDGTCPDCGEKIRMRGQPHGCKGKR